MRKLLLIAGLSAIVAAPGLAEARTACERDRANTRIAGTVGGGLLGALAGHTVAGRGDRTEGAVIGGVLGAVAGNQLLKKRSPCPPGYVVRTTAPRPVAARSAAPAAPRCTWQDEAYRDAYGSVVNRQVQVCR